MDIKLKTSKCSLICKNVPITSWKELRPYWQPIAKALIETFLEGNFKPYSVRKNKQDGFYVAPWYWEQSSIRPQKYPLKEAKMFLKLLRKNQDFIKAVRNFNSVKGVNWLHRKNVKQLRHFIYSICHELESYLKTLHRKQRQQYL